MPGKTTTSKPGLTWAFALTLFMFGAGGIVLAKGDGRDPRVLIGLAWTCGALSFIAVSFCVYFSCKSRQGLDKDGEESHDLAILLSVATALWFMAWVGFSLCLLYWNVVIVKAVCALIIWGPTAWLGSGFVKALGKDHGPPSAETYDYIDRRRAITGEYDSWRRR